MENYLNVSESKKEVVKIKKNGKIKFRRGSVDNFDVDVPNFSRKEVVYPLLSGRNHTISPTRGILRGIKDYFLKPVECIDGLKMSKFDLFINDTILGKIILSVIMAVGIYALLVIGIGSVPMR